MIIILMSIYTYAHFPKLSNVKDLKAVSEYFNDRPFLSCSFNGYSVDCDKMKELQQKQKTLDKRIDPNMMKH